MEQHRPAIVHLLLSLMVRIPTLWESISQFPVRQDNANNLMERLSILTTGYTPDPEQEAQEATYYDYPVLKQPFWRWEIIWYFF